MSKEIVPTFHQERNGCLVYRDDDKDIEIVLYPPVDPDKDPSWMGDGFPNDPVPLRYFKTYEEAIEFATKCCNDPIPPSE